MMCSWTVAFHSMPNHTDHKSFSVALFRGFLQRCPRCGHGALFARYLRVNEYCESCGLTLGKYRADDAPAYFTIALVGHLIVPLILVVEQTSQPPTWLHMAIWLPLTLGLTLAALPRVKGALLGAQWKLRVNG